MLAVVNKQESIKGLQEMTELSLEYVSFITIISLLSFKQFPGRCRSSFPVKPIFARTQPVFGRTSIHSLRHTSIREPPPLILPPLPTKLFSSFCTWTWVRLHSWIVQSVKSGITLSLMKGENKSVKKKKNYYNRLWFHALCLNCCFGSSAFGARTLEMICMFLVTLELIRCFCRC